METSSSHGDLDCPDCRAALHPVASRDVLAHRCGRCRGVWLDPEAFRRLCERDERAPGEETALARASTPPFPRGAGSADTVKYRRCPACRDVMNRTNFARVSGVIIDVCRAHGAWFDRGELAAIWGFLRAGGAGRFERHRRLDDERERHRPGPAAGRRGPPMDVYDVLVGGDGPWDVPGRFPRPLLASLLAALGVWSLWRAFHPGSWAYWTVREGAGLFGILCLYLAWRALGAWMSRRGR